MTDTSGNNGSIPRLIIAFTEDLFLQPRLQDAAVQLGFILELIDRADSFGSQASETSGNRALTEPLRGPDSGLVRWLSAVHPVLLIFDTSSKELPWRHWIQMLKTSAATRRIPILALGPHVDERAMEVALAAGANQVFTRGQFQSRLAPILKAFAEQPIQAQLESACRGPLSDLALRGIELHNRGDYFAAHEALEHAWMNAGEYEGYLYRALLQVSVAHFHLERGNNSGAAKLLMRVHRWLDPLPDSCRGLNLGGLRHSVAELRERLYHSLDREDTSPMEFNPIRFEASKEEPHTLQGGNP